jgi:iron complex transport system substrate-binding protein
MKKKIIALILTFVLAGGLISGCSQDTDKDGGGSASSASVQTVPADGGITLTDMLGREVTLEAAAERVVALAPSDVEILYAIGADDMLTGRGEYCDYPPEALEIPSVQSGNETNIEQIIALEPQLLIMGKMAQSEEQVGQLEDAGIAVFVLDAQDIEGTYTAIELIGKLVGRESEAGDVIQGMKDVFAEVSEKAAAAEDSEKSIYFEVSPLEYGLWTTGTGTFMDDAAGILRLKNAFGDISGWAEISEEQVIERNPDYILTVGMQFGEGPTPADEILSRPGWGDVAAVKNGAILNLTANELSRPGPRLADGVRMLYEFVYEGGTDTPDAPQ